MKKMIAVLSIALSLTMVSAVSAKLTIGNNSTDDGFHGINSTVFAKLKINVDQKAQVYNEVITYGSSGSKTIVCGEVCDGAALFEESIQVVGGSAMVLEWSGADLLSADASPAGDGTEFQVGDCINGAIGWNRSNTDVVPCTAPHTYQIVGKVAYVTADDTFPGRDALLQLGDEECDAAFEGFVGIAYDDSIWHMSIWVPTSGTWEAGDRDVVCALQGADGESIIGSKEGSAE